MLVGQEFFSMNDLVLQNIVISLGKISTLRCCTLKFLKTMDFFGIFFHMLLSVYLTKFQGDRPPHGTSVYLRHKPDLKKNFTQYIYIPQFKFMYIGAHLAKNGKKMCAKFHIFILAKKNIYALFSKKKSQE